MTERQTLRLNNGVTMPALGFGVFQTPPEETAASLETALRVGYRLIDTAAAYANEREVGEGIRRPGIARDDVFLETKVWISDYGYNAIVRPGVNLNPADTSYGEQVLEPSLRRR